MKRRSNYIINSIAIFLTLFLFKSITQYVQVFDNSKNPIINDTLGYLASIGFYLTMFNLLKWSYSTFIEDLIHKRSAFKGEWFFKISVNNHKSEFRYGILELFKAKDKLHFNTVHYDTNLKDFTVSLSSEEIISHKGELIILFNSKGLEETRFFRRGIIYLTVIGNPPNRLKGIWSDINGDTTLYDGEIELLKRSEDTDRILQDIGYPLP